MEKERHRHEQLGLRGESMDCMDLAINIFTSGKVVSYEKYKEENAQKGISDYLIKYVSMNFIHIFGSVVAIIFVFENLAKNSYFDAAACAFVALVAITDFVVLRTRVAPIVPAVISMISFGLFCVLVVWNGDAQGMGLVFIYIYPMLTVILLGIVKGAVFSVVLLALVVAECLVPGGSKFDYNLDASLRTIAVYVLIFGITLVFEISRETKDRVNEKLTLKIRETNENLQNIVAERTEKIVMLQNSILKTMAHLVEYRDLITGEHIERTQRGVNLLLSEIRNQKLFEEIIDAWDIDLILQSVQLHDIGKIAISDRILNKPARLTKDEYDQMKAHTTFGLKIIERIEADSGESELLTHAKIFAVSHHERWDGSGYPYGLRGDAIPLQGRIMAIADVYDALISERPYKKAYAHEHAVEIIAHGKGTQFDPVLTDLFIEIKSKF